MDTPSPAETRGKGYEAVNVETLEVRHDVEARRFVAELECGQAYVAYRLDGAVMDIASTWVPRQHRRLGIGERVVVSALEHARAEGYRVIPSCPFVPRVIEAHAEYRDLIADQTPRRATQSPGSKGTEV